MLIYFGIAFVSGGVEQTIMLFFAGSGSLGASGVVFGMIAIVMLWAPENEVTLTVMALILFRPYVATFNASLLLVCFVMIAMEFLTASLTGFAMSSAVLHLLGAVPGAARLADLPPSILVAYAAEKKSISLALSGDAAHRV